MFDSLLVKANKERRINEFESTSDFAPFGLQGSFDDTGSRPITPPQIPDVLPPNVKVSNKCMSHLREFSL